MRELLQVRCCRAANCKIGGLMHAPSAGPRHCTCSEFVAMAVTSARVQPCIVSKCRQLHGRHPVEGSDQAWPSSCQVMMSWKLFYLQNKSDAQAAALRPNITWSSLFGDNCRKTLVAQSQRHHRKRPGSVLPRKPLPGRLLAHPLPTQHQQQKPTVQRRLAAQRCRNQPAAAGLLTLRNAMRRRRQRLRQCSRACHQLTAR